MPAKKMLVVDDEGVVLNLLRRLLTGPSYELHLAESITRARGFLAVNPDYTLLIVDLRLPDGRGDDFIMEFQAASPLGRVMVMSGHPSLVREIPILEAKGIACLLKPFKRWELKQAVSVLTGDEVFNSPRKGTMKTVLVVDDERGWREMIEFNLVGYGYRALTAPDGQAALDILAGEKIDLVLADLRMPGMDGLALVAAIRKAAPALPVVLMTGHGEEERLAKTMAEPPPLFKKPFSIDDLNRLVHRFVGGK
jgi:DNA-binding NtrC family response regulator